MTARAYHRAAREHLRTAVHIAPPTSGLRAGLVRALAVAEALTPEGDSATTLRRRKRDAQERGPLREERRALMTALGVLPAGAR